MDFMLRLTGFFEQDAEKRAGGILRGRNGRAYVTDERIEQLVINLRILGIGILASPEVS